VSLDLLGVSGRSGLSIVGGHLGGMGRCAYLVSDFMGIKPTVMVKACRSVAIGDWGPSDRLYKWNDPVSGW
jgi:hypothetical protein